jgi:hypothetical protein
MIPDPTTKPFTQDTLSTAHQRDVEAAKGLPTEVLQLIDCEYVGGPCPRCSTKWQIVKVRNQFGNFDYFKPACSCYPPPCPGVHANYRVTYYHWETARGEERYSHFKPDNTKFTVHYEDQRIDHDCAEPVHREFAATGQRVCATCLKIERYWIGRTGNQDDRKAERDGGKR